MTLLKRLCDIHVDGDRTYCNHCGTQWETKDPSPPMCRADMYCDCGYLMPSWIAPMKDAHHKDCSYVMYLNRREKYERK